MVKTKKHSCIWRAAIASVLCIVIILTLASCNQKGGSTEVYTKDELAANINTESVAEFDYAADYFNLWKLPQFNMTKIKKVEKKIHDNYVLSLPEPEDFARAAALKFLDTYYGGDDELNTSDIDAVTDALLYSLVSEMGDKYAYYRNDVETDSFDTDMSGQICGIGVLIQRLSDGTCEIIEVYEGSGAFNSGLKAGDIITAVDGTVLTPKNQESGMNMISGKAGTTVKITVSRNGSQMEFTVTRSVIVVPSVTYEIIGTGEEMIGYIRISSFKANTDDQFTEAINALESADVKGIMFDLRSNPGGYLDSVVNAIDYLIPDRNKIVSYKFKNSPETVEYSKTSHSIKIPSVVLCDEYTASAGELFCAAMRDYNTSGIFNSTVVGEVTYGKGVMQSTFSFLDGSSITMTTAYYNPPSGVNYNDDGIAPDGVIPDIIISDDQSTNDIDELYDAGLAELYALVQMHSGSISKELLLNNIATAEVEEFKYISNYLRLWKFPIFDKTKLDTVQTIYQTSIGSEMTVEDMARSVADIFLNQYYDKTEMSDQTKMTSALVNSWLDTLGDEFGQYRDAGEYEDYVYENSDNKGIGISYNTASHKITKVMASSPAERAGILVGDMLYAVEGVRYTDNNDQIMALIKDHTKSVVQISILRGDSNTPINLKVARSYEHSDVITYSIIENDIGYIQITRFRENISTHFTTAVNYVKSHGAKGIIFDLRGNSGGELAQVVGVIEQFAKSGDTIIEIDYFSDTYTDQTIKANKNGDVLNDSDGSLLPVVVICNADTASAAELFVASVRDYTKSGTLNAKTVGTVTFGKGIMQSTQKLYDGTAVTYTVAYYNPPCGVNYDKIGITPDYIVEDSTAQRVKAIKVLREMIED